MTGLRELFDELAATPAPAQPMSGAELFAAGRRRRRRQRTMTAAALAVLSVVTAGTLALRAATPGDPVDPALPAGRVTVSPGGPAELGHQIQQIAVVDRNHFYGWRLYCPQVPCAKQWIQVIASTDGGRTWSERGQPIGIGELVILGRDTLLIAPLVRSGAEVAPLVSTDGGRSWTTAVTGPAVAAVRTDDALVCWEPERGQPCRLFSVDRETGRLSPLAAGPPLILRGDSLALVRPDRPGGVLWVAGADPASGRPAVTGSADQGRTWSTHVFTDLATCVPGGCELRSVVGGPGTVGYVILHDPVSRRPLIYRGALGGPWQRLDTSLVSPDRAGYDAAGYLTADGTHVWCQHVAQPGRDIDGCRFWAVGRTEQRYRQVSLEGLPATVDLMARASDGSYYARDYATDRLYGSTDGWHWTPISG